MVKTEQDIMFKQRNCGRENRQQIRKLSGCSKGASINNKSLGVKYNLQHSNLGLFEAKRVEAITKHNAERSECKELITKILPVKISWDLNRLSPLHGGPQQFANC